MRELSVSPTQRIHRKAAARRGICLFAETTGHASHVLFVVSPDKVQSGRNPLLRTTGLAAGGTSE